MSRNFLAGGPPIRPKKVLSVPKNNKDLLVINHLLELKSKTKKVRYG